MWHFNEQHHKWADASAMVSEEWLASIPGVKNELAALQDEVHLLTFLKSPDSFLPAKQSKLLKTLLSRCQEAGLFNADAIYTEIRVHDALNALCEDLDFILEDADASSFNSWVETLPDKIWHQAQDEEEIKEIDISNVKAGLFTVISPMLNDLDGKRQALEQKIDDLSFEKFYFNKILERLMKKPAPTELVLLGTNNVDQDLQEVIGYRHKKNPNLFVIDLRLYKQVLEFAERQGISTAFPSITKMGLLHHSGGRLVLERNFQNEDLKIIGNSLPMVTDVVLRGCGLADNKNAQKAALEAAEAKWKESPDLSKDVPNRKLLLQAMKQGRLLFGPPQKQKPIRETTLEIDDKGFTVASELTRGIVSALKDSGLGAKSGKQTTIKYYVGPYEGSETGARASEGINDDDRFKALPKAIRTSL